MKVSLRDVHDRDLPVFWAQSSDREVQQMAAVTREYHYDRDHFDRHWSKVRTDPTVIVQTIVADGTVAGHAAVFGAPAEREVTYVVGRDHWGLGIATAALSALIELEPTRPLHADTVADNVGSIRVLEKCGFANSGSSRCFARARDTEIDVVRLTLT